MKLNPQLRHLDFQFQAM